MPNRRRLPRTIKTEQGIIYVAALILWNRANRRARDEYYLHPFENENAK